MRALVSRIKELAATRRAFPPPALSSLSAHLFHHVTNKSNVGPIRTPPPPPPSRNEVADEQTPTIIDGKSIAEEIRSGIAKDVCRMKDGISKVPGLAVIFVGQRRNSQTYVRNTVKACQEVGITSLMAGLPEDCAEDEIVNVVSSFNVDPSVHGILVQLPLPQKYNATVSSVHALSKNPEEITREADIMISAAGVANLVRGNWLKRGTVVIDVGTNPVADSSSEHGYHLTGAICYASGLSYNPVPGGVGPVTTAMLLSNALDSPSEHMD